MKSSNKPNKLRKKAAVELSAGFLVILILSLVIFGIGIMLVSQIFTSAETLKQNLDEQTAAEIRNTLKDNSLVSLPFNRLEIKRKAYDVTGIGILNKLGSTKLFYVSVECNAALGKGDVVLCDEDGGKMCDGEGAPGCGLWVTADSEGVSLDHNEDTVSDMFIHIPADAPSGNYVFNVKVCYERSCKEQGQLYGTLKKLYVNVP